MNIIKRNKILKFWMMRLLLSEYYHNHFDLSETLVQSKEKKLY
jgi:hypothetical protein